MALVKCNNCGHMVSDMADVCPKCGAAVTQAPVETQPQPEAVSNNPNKPKRKGVIIACIVAVLLLIGGGAAWYVHGSDKASKNGNEHPVYSEELRKKAEAGDAVAQCDLGVCYTYGYGTELNLAEALRWYQKAAEQGNASGQRNLGLCYEIGEGVEKDMTEAVRLYKLAADQNDGQAQLLLGLCYAAGKGMEINYDEAARLFQKSAEQGNSFAQYQIGMCYDWGYGVSQNYSEAAKWYRKSANQGDVAGEVALGLCYVNGRGVPQNYQEAFRLFKSAAEKGDAEGIYRLGICYGRGEGVERNQAEADRLYQLAADKGYQPAIDFLNQQRTGIVSSSRQKEKETVNFTGTYEFNDGFHTWVLVLNADESATIQEKEHQNDPDMTSYGSWSYYKYTQPDNLDLRFTDLAAKVWFKSSNNFVSLSYPVINIKDGFLYMDDNAAKAKNPNLRIKLTKTK